MKQYYVKSMGLAAWLMAHNLDLLNAEKTDSGYHLFWFEDTTELQNCIEDYYKQEMLQKYTRAHITLKKLIKATT